MKYTSKEWITKVNKIHNGFFDYTKTVYINSYHKVKITCPVHGEFEADPISHMRGNKCCPGCRHNTKLTKDGFIKRCYEIHGTTLDFSKSIFINTRTKVKVICPIHGEFYKEPRLLLSNNIYNGCSLCKNFDNTSSCNLVKKYQNNKKLGKQDGVFYKILVSHIKSKLKFIKIGITSLTTYQRYKLGYGEFEFNIIEEYYGTNLECAIKEEEYKKSNKDKRFYLSKDLKFGGKTECYIYDDIYQLKYDQIKLIRDHLIAKQDNICPICNNFISLPTLDHHHSKKNMGSSLCRGVLCNTCNRFLGVIENNLLRNKIQLSNAGNVLRNIADYIESEQTTFIHPSECPKTPVLSKRCFNQLCKKYSLKYPKKKPLKYPKSKKLTKPLEKLFNEFKIQIIYNK